MYFLWAIVALSTLIYIYFKWTYSYWKRRNIPYFDPSIPFGNTQAPYSRTLSFSDEIHQHYLVGKTKGWKYFGIHMILRPALLVTDLDLIKNILTKDFNNFTKKGVYCNVKHEPIGINLITTGGHEWKYLRTKLSPTFTSGKIKNMFETLVDCASLLEIFLGEKIERKQPIDIKCVLTHFTTDIIGSCAFGIECNSFKEPNSLFRKYCAKIFKRNALGVLNNMLAKNFPRVAQALDIRVNSEDVTEFFTNVVTQTVTYREKNNIERKDFLQMLIDIKNNKNQGENGFDERVNILSMNEIVAHSFNLFVAGYETSSTAMTFILYELAVNPDIQQKVREEVDMILKRYNNHITYDSINELEYMDQVIDESLRKYPPAAMLSRECTEDYTIPDTENVIEKGTLLYISMRGIHYDEDYYENPEIFNPERFSKEAKGQIHPYAFLPFGEGPRICMGMRFALTQTKVGLAYLLRSYRFKLSEKTKVPLKMSANATVTEAEGGIWLTIENL